ncbi:MAG: glycosyltransferase family 39 protein [Candidatus Marsarchaeota archaeon]|nr:glycosyltransferase family 39 protein [Candidatus Marsarchaeota archaeon]
MLLLIAIIALGLAISLLIYAGPNAVYDDSTYMGIAHMYSNGVIEFNNVFSYGFLFTGMITLSGMAFGYTDFSAIFVSIAGFVFLVLFTFMAGKELGGERLGIIAGFFVSTAPIIDANVTRVVPDIATGAVVAASLYFLIKGLKSKKPLMFFYSGVVGALSVYVKMEGLIFLMGMFLAVMTFAIFSKSIKRKKQKRKMRNRIDVRYPAYMLVGIVLLLLLYLVPFYTITGNPIYALQNYGRAQVQARGGYQMLLLPFEAANPIMFYNLGWTYYYMYPFGLFVLFFMLGCLLLIKHRDSKARYIAAIALLCFLFMFYGSTSLSHYRSFGTLPRFFDDIIAPMALTAAVFVEWMALKISGGKNRTASLFIVALFIFVLLDQAGVYGFLGSNNSEISGANAFYMNLTRYAASIAIAKPVSLYVMNAERDGQPESHGVIMYLNYTLTPYKNVSVYGRSESCAANQGTEKLLLLENGAGYGYSNMSNMDTWLAAGGCSVTLMEQYAPEGYVEARLYKIS